MKLNPERVLFVGLSRTASCWFRCALPALSIGSDWIGMRHKLETGYVKGKFQEPNLDDYDIIILQQPFSEEAHKQIKDMRDHGQIVLYEIDDNTEGVFDPIAEHPLYDKWDKERLYWTQKCQEVSSGIICSTERLSELYADRNKTYTCLNGIDAGRYMTLEIPERDTINYFWAGGHGHNKAMRTYAPALVSMLNRHKNTKLVTLGDPTIGRAFYKQNSERTLVLPWAFMEIYPSAMMNGDIGLAPACEDSFFSYKSDLRFLEYGMAGIPAVYNPHIYLEVEDGVTGLLASDSDECEHQLDRLTTDLELRQTISKNARDYVLANRTFPLASEQWIKAFNNCLDET
jgi:glycosyltransferase involved in cell wall biosynthesis